MVQLSRNLLTIGTLANRYGVSPESLRIWERQGLIPPAIRTVGGHRRYGKDHVEALDRLMTAPQPRVLALPVAMSSASADGAT